jgi:hypothetical protein
MWTKASVVGAAVFVVPTTLAMIYIESSHDHEEKQVWPHMKNRKKAFPWKAHDCDFFDKHCAHEYNHKH